MADLISEHYLDELNDWNDTISDHELEIHTFREKLYAIIQRDSIPEIAKKVEPFFELLNHQTQIFSSLKEAIQLQVEHLLKDETPLGNTEIVSDVKVNQDTIRKRMHIAEIEYIDAKYACYQFLASI